MEVDVGAAPYGGHQPEYPFSKSLTEVTTLASVMVMIMKYKGKSVDMILPLDHYISEGIVATRASRRTSSSLASPESANGPLKGMKILDLSRVLAAPYCSQILADYGADVIKVEDIDRGDDTRYWRQSGEESSWKSDAGPISYYFAAVNRNKRSICLNLKSEKGRDIFLRLARQADVVIDNFRPGALERLRLGYDTLSELNPRIIHASVTGYGPSGPFAKRAGYDMIAGAEAGLLHLTGEKNGPPVRPGLGLTDISTGLYTHGAIMAALYARERTGRGQKIDASLFETQVALLSNVALAWLNLGQEAERWGTQHPSVVPYDAFKTKDFYFVCGATNDKQFTTLCRLLGEESLASDERFKTSADRVNNRDDLFSILNRLFAKKSMDEWIQEFEGSGMPYAPINTMEKVFAHPQTEARHMVESIPHNAAVSGSIKILGPAVKFSDTEPTIRSDPPLLGQHTTDILEELGYDDMTIKTFMDDRVVGGHIGADVLKVE
ncbi:uncharacterized protein A1O5_06202 [Cladophialophora psammophila CBS 110553]|uniref:Alpha-methylacyl-CoA racemase n=1 Tax=Cladophialophora psammophila CBS 110553 TaxID=1182543 RepID=W9WTD5_9EURO|nr:uncharacterized protein A1O5_06202 [Cladophialophora psammophila CBS 110553]EXJ71208.1 hypothetical protein A1O5_06202 [Cladophialophora psammophila CBS 110553]